MTDKSGGQGRSGVELFTAANERRGISSKNRYVIIFLQAGRNLQVNTVNYRSRLGHVFVLFSPSGYRRLKNAMRETLRAPIQRRIVGVPERNC